MTEPINPTPKKLVGFAAMPADRQREIARMGQAALAASGRRHKWTPEKAREAAALGWARRRGAA